MVGYSINSRMVDALMQFTNDLSTDSDSTDESDDEDTNGGKKRGFSWDLSGDKPMSALPPMMLSDSHVDVSTEEEDNNEVSYFDHEPIFTIVSPRWQGEPA